MFRQSKRIRHKRDIALARRLWPSHIGREQLQSLEYLAKNYGFSVVAGDLLLLENRWYVTHSGLLRLGQRRHCLGIAVSLMSEFCDVTTSRWVFRAVVFKDANSKGFEGYGDADPSNVSSLVQGAEMRVAETRAVNRALRKAYGIGLCSVEELGSSSGGFRASGESTTVKQPNNGSTNGQPRLRDKLLLLIRQYGLDPVLVKSYAADFCGTEKLSDASREMVESFIGLLEKSAKENRESLVCRLNSYRTAEVHS